MNYQYLLALCLALSFFTGTAQNDSTLYEVKTMDGNTYTGRIVQKEAEYILLATKNIGTVTIRFDDVKVIERLSGPGAKPAYASSGSKRPPLANSGSREHTTYFVSPTGYGLKKGEAYYQNYLLFISHFNMGITNHFSLGFGLIPFGEGIPVWITPKVSFPVVKDLVNIGVGSFNGLSLDQEVYAFGAYFGTLTIGSRERNFSLGAGKAYEDGGPADLALSLNATWRLGDRTFFVAENYSLRSFSTGSVGGRHLFNTTSLTYGLVYYREENFFLAFPFVGLMVPFSLKK